MEGKKNEDQADFGGSKADYGRGGAYHRAVLELEKTKTLVEREEKQPIMPLWLLSDFQPLFDERQYCDMEEKMEGTLSGAPKLRACEIIDELEIIRRVPIWKYWEFTMSRWWRHSRRECCHYQRDFKRAGAGSQAGSGADQCGGRLTGRSRACIPNGMWRHGQRTDL